MIVRITGISIDDSPLSFEPYLTEIPDMEIGWDGGHDHIERMIEGEEFPDEIIDQIPDPENFKSFEFEFDYDHEVTITCA